MIKLIIFDLDGVLVEAKDIHFIALNEALASVSEQYVISWADHLSKYDGLKTNQKLDMLTKHNGLPLDQHKNIWDKKQQITLKKLSLLKPSKTIQEALTKLVEDGYKIACCSNSIRKTIPTKIRFFRSI
jgi:beta-phosphoglucomutase-like phosphatase (HAD superfamily)